MGPLQLEKRQSRPLKLNFCLFRIFQCVAGLKHDGFCIMWLLAGWREAPWECLAQEHITMSPARARTRIRRRSGVERANHETSVPPKGPRAHCYIVNNSVRYRGAPVYTNVSSVYSLLTALSGSLPIKVKISATVETNVFTFTSQSVWSSAEHRLCFFWTFALQRCNLRTSCMPSWTAVDWSKVDGADSERLRSGEEGAWSWFNEVAANM